MDLYLLISAVLGIAVLITFFGLSSKLRAIKETVLEVPKEDAKTKYYIHFANGEMDKARYHLEYIIFHQLNKSGQSDSERKKLYENLKKKYATHYEKLGATFPEYPYA
jgi:hypothetical protein